MVTELQFDDLIETYRVQRERVERAHSLPAGGAELALGELDKMRALIAGLSYGFSNDQRAELEAEFDRMKSALRKHMEN